MIEAFVFAVIVFGGLLLRFVMTLKGPVRFRKKPVLTGGDREFFFRLRHALPECLVCPQVAVSALLEPAGVGKIRRAASDCIDGKKVGYAIFNEEMQLLAVVELDHRGRRSRRAAARDACFASAGIRTVRFHTKRLPSETRIRRSVFPRPSHASGRTIDISTLDRDAAIEFRRPETPWRNTVNAHI